MAGFDPSTEGNTGADPCGASRVARRGRRQSAPNPVGGLRGVGPGSHAREPRALPIEDSLSPTQGRGAGAEESSPPSARPRRSRCRSGWAASSKNPMKTATPSPCVGDRAGCTRENSGGPGALRPTHAGTRSLHWLRLPSTRRSRFSAGDREGWRPGRRAEPSPNREATARAPSTGIAGRPDRPKSPGTTARAGNWPIASATFRPRIRARFRTGARQGPLPVDGRTSLRCG